MREKAFKAITGRTHGIRLRIKPPINANNKAVIKLISDKELSKTVGVILIVSLISLKPFFEDITPEICPSKVSNMERASEPSCV